MYVFGESGEGDSAFLNGRGGEDQQRRARPPLEVLRHRFAIQKRLSNAIITTPAYSLPQFSLSQLQFSFCPYEGDCFRMSDLMENMPFMIDLHASLEDSTTCLFQILADTEFWLYGVIAKDER